MIDKKGERYLILDNLLRQNKKNKLSKAELLNELNNQLTKENFNSIRMTQFEKDIDYFKNKLKGKISIEQKGQKTLYFYNRRDISINSKLGFSSKDLLLALDFLKGHQDKNDFLNKAIQEITKKFNIHFNEKSAFHIDSNHLYDKEYSKFISQIFNSIKNQKVLIVHYEINEKNIKIFSFHPHLLKEFNGRWFVFGFCEEYENVPNFQVRLDRITKITDSENIYNISKFRKQDYVEYFDKRIGVSNRKIDGIENIEHLIKLKFNKEYYDYFLTKPISQILKSDFVDNNEFVIVTFKLFINNELISRILSFKSNVEVLEPYELRQLVKKEIIKLIDLYNQS